ncbi:MAG: hypothetical protein ACRDH5_04260, partial [bacterium]
NNPLASNGGPFNPETTLRCELNNNGNRPDNRCVHLDEGIAVQLSGYGTYQRLFSVYDGPAVQESNAYLNIKHRKIEDCKVWVDSVNHAGGCDKGAPQSHGNTSVWLAGTSLGLPKGYTNPANPKPEEAFCFMPNAAIGWKQPNGFYYPPAFHSKNLFFKDVETRHFVISPPFKEGTLAVDFQNVELNYCVFNSGIFTGFAGNDRQTVLNDDDGTLTGYTASTVINLDPFFAAPVQAVECASESSSRTSPYHHVTTVLYPKCVLGPGQTCARPPNPNPPGGDGDLHKNDGDWNLACTDESCHGIPLFRQDLMAKSDHGIARSIRMMGQSTAQRSTLTVDAGTYYLDTAVSKKVQCQPQNEAECSNSRSTTSHAINVFKPGGTYYLFLIYAKEETKQTYRFYVGPTTSSTPSNPLGFISMQAMQADIRTNPIVFQNFREFPATQVKWYNNDKTTGIVEVTLDVKELLPGIATKFNDVRKKKCQPLTYCTPDADGRTCRDNNSTASPKASDVCKWAIDDIDCPDGGCVGFVFTLPATFATTDTP